MMTKMLHNIVATLYLINFHLLVKWLLFVFRHFLEMQIRGEEIHYDAR